MFERGMYLSFFYCFCYVKEISMDILEEQMSEDSQTYLNGGWDIRMEDST